MAFPVPENIDSLQTGVPLNFTPSAKQAWDDLFIQFHQADAPKLLAIQAELQSLKQGMDEEASKTAKDSLELAFRMSNILDTGVDRHTLSVLIALCDLGVNPEALAAVVKELRRESVSESGIGTGTATT